MVIKLAMEVSYQFLNVRDIPPLLSSKILMRYVFLTDSVICFLNDSVICCLIDSVMFLIDSVMCL